MKRTALLLLALSFTACSTTEKSVAENKVRPSSGFVTLKFDVNKEGKAENIRVVEENPAQVFRKAAIQQVESRKYAKSEKGELPPFKDNELKIEFVERK